ncbi:MAG: T9SS type A sorting domain-containing protein [Fimbriimonadaceae bacterium]|nr:T9SS type A sorting domain-containing protein [Chitinophagales bacterium]
MIGKYYEPKLTVVFLFTALACVVNAQEMAVWQPNLVSFTGKNIFITNELMSLSSAEAQAHPEFGMLPYNAPCTDCFELIDKRTPDHRYYIKPGSSGNEFYSQSCFGDFHYQDELGRWISYDPRLTADKTEDNVYLAIHQETPTEIDLENKYAAFKVNGDEFQFNKNLRLKNVTSDGDIIDLGFADWSNYTIGDNGVKVIDAWDGIDIEIVFNLHSIKSNFIINEPLDITSGYLIIEDTWNLPDGYTVQNNIGEDTPDGWKGSLQVNSTNIETYFFEIDKALVYDASGIRENAINGIYKYNDVTSIIELKISAEWLNDPLRIFPVIIDPLVTSSATYSSGQMKFRYNGTFCPGPDPDCSYNLSVPLPANCTLTGATFSAEYKTTVGTCVVACQMSDAGFQIIGPCDYSPSTTLWWSCISPSGDTTGICSGANLDMFSTVSCLAPLCSGSVNFSMNNSFCYCPFRGNCPPSGIPCTSMSSGSWSITLSGHNLETLGDGVDGSGSTIITGSCCVNSILDPLPAYGVPPYTYLWNTGATSSTLTVNSCSNGSFPYTCTVTDACNTIRIASFTYNVSDCLLSIDIINFDASWNGNAVLINWTTASEKENDYFTLERSKDGNQFYAINTIDAAGESNMEIQYSSTDNNPFPGINYYRLKQTSFSGKNSYSKIISVSTLSNELILLYPNPASEEIILEYLNPVQYFNELQIEITDITGKKILRMNWNVMDENLKHLDIKQLAEGFYQLNISDGFTQLHYSFMKEN